MTLARVSTNRTRELVVVRLLEDGSFVLRDETGDTLVFEESSPLECVEVRCDFCGRWSTDAAPVGGSWESWMCYGGTGACP